MRVKLVWDGVKAGWHWMALLALLCFAVALYPACFDTQIAGFLHDDGIYLMTSQMLAQGKGFILPNLLGTPAQVKYPPFYSLVLSLGWQFNRAFPANLLNLHLLTTAFAWLSIPCLFVYLNRIQQLSRRASLLITALVASNFYFIFYATAIMSEAPYFFFSLLAVMVAESGWIQNTFPAKSNRTKIGILCLLMAAAFYTRTVGLALLLGLLLFFLLKRQWKLAVKLTLGGIVVVLPWLSWVKSHTPKLTADNYPLVYLYGGYGVEWVIHTWAELGSYCQAVFKQGVFPLMQGVFQSLMPGLEYGLNQILPASIGTIIGANLVCLLMLFPLISAVKARQWSPSGLYIVVYLVILSLWMYPNQAIRFLVVVQPWLWLALYRSYQQLIARPLTNYRPIWLKSVKGLIALSLCFTTLIPAFQGYKLLKLIRSSHWLEPSGHYSLLWDDYQALFSFVRDHTPQPTVVGAIWDPVFYLYAQRHTYGIYMAALKPVNGKITAQSFALLYHSLKAGHVAYITEEPWLENQQVLASQSPVVQGLKQLYPDRLQLVYQSPHKYLKLWRLN